MCIRTARDTRSGEGTASVCSQRSRHPKPCDANGLKKYGSSAAELAAGSDNKAKVGIPENMRGYRGG